MNDNCALLDYKCVSLTNWSPSYLNIMFILKPINSANDEEKEEMQ